MRSNSYIPFLFRRMWPDHHLSISYRIAIVFSLLLYTVRNKIKPIKPTNPGKRFVYKKNKIGFWLGNDETGGTPYRSGPTATTYNLAPLPCLGMRLNSPLFLSKLDSKVVNTRTHHGGQQSFYHLIRDFGMIWLSGPGFRLL